MTDIEVPKLPAIAPAGETDQLLGVTGGTTTGLMTIAEILDFAPTAGGAINSGTLFDENLSGNPNLAQSWWLQAATDGFDVTPGFPDTFGFDIDYSVLHGLDVSNGNQTNKITFGALFLNCTYQGSGQRNTFVKQINDYGTGDLFAESTLIQYAGCNTGSDEGKGFHSIGHLYQQPDTTTSTIDGIGPRSSVSATTTQAINQDGNNPQTVSITGTPPNAGDWVIVDQDNLAPGLSNAEAVKVISATASSFTAIFRLKHNTSVVVLPATVLTIDDVTGFGEDRWLVDISATPYATGTIDSISGGTVNGSGTTWTASVAGGDAHNPGVIYFGADVITSGGFFGPGIGNQLTSYYPISAVGSNTSLTISLLYNFGSESYRGLSGNGDTYAIYPAVKVMWIAPGATQGPLTGTQQVICSYTAATFNVNDNMELAFGPNPTITPWSFQVQDFTPGSLCNPFFQVQNIGINAFRAGFYIDGSATVGGNTTNGFNTGLMCVNVGVPFVCTNNPADPQYNSPHGFPASRMVYLSQVDGTNLDYFHYAGGGGATRFIANSYGGTLASPTGVPANSFITELVAAGYDTTQFATGGSIQAQAIELWSSSNHGLAWNFNTVPRGKTGQILGASIPDYGGFNYGQGVDFATLPSASTELGSFVQINDSTVTTGNVTTGGGSHVVIAYSNVTNWVVLVDLT